MTTLRIGGSRGEELMPRAGKVILLMSGRTEIEMLFTTGLLNNLVNISLEIFLFLWLIVCVPAVIILGMNDSLSYRDFLSFSTMTFDIFDGTKFHTPA
jgi:hypothetical protein